MSESSGIDSPLRGAEMPKAYSGDLRERVIEAVEAGASRHEAAEYFEVSVASAVKWLQRWNKERSAAPKPRGGSVSSLWRFFDRHNVTLKKRLVSRICGQCLAPVVFPVRDTERVR